MFADPIGLFGLLALWLFGKSEVAPASPTRTLPGPPAPWPQVLPPDLPPFPGRGWEYDEPPPRAVQQRAGQLVHELWARGKGSSKTEQTAGRWITYQAQIVRSGKKGVVAYRLAGAAKKPAAAPQIESRAPTAPPELRAVLTSTSPGWPQAKGPGQRWVKLVAGRWYQWNARIDGAPPGLAEGIARGLSAAGAVNIGVSTTPPYVLIYQLKAAASGTLVLDVPQRIRVGSVEVSITYTAVSEIKAPPKAPTGPGEVIVPPEVVMTNAPPPPGSVPYAVPGGTIHMKPEGSPIAFRTLRRGMGVKPQEPLPDVMLLQRKLGIPADGRFGSGTEAAVKAYQRKARLQPDGIVGTKTWTSLFAVQV